MLETGMNTLQKDKKIHNFALTTSPHYLIKNNTKTANGFLHCVCRLFVTLAESSKFLFLFFVKKLLENSFSNLLAKNVCTFLQIFVTM